MRPDDLPGTPDRAEPAAHVEAVRDIHNDAIQQIFEIGLSIQSAAARHALSDRLRRQVDELVAALDATVRACHLAAYQLGPVECEGAADEAENVLSLQGLA
jgi:DNA-binding GntR family transcriptional regulator